MLLVCWIFALDQYRLLSLFVSASYVCLFVGRVAFTQGQVATVGLSEKCRMWTDRPTLNRFTFRMSICQLTNTNNIVGQSSSLRPSCTVHMVSGNVKSS